MKKIKLEITGLSYSQTQSGAYALVLSEHDSNRRLPIIIGGFEAQAIAIELEKMTPSRPLTHDLFKTFADAFEINLAEIIIYNLVEGIFFAKLVCEKDNKLIEIDARTSDAIALAVRFNCSIYTYEFILASASILLENDGTIKSESDKKLDTDTSNDIKNSSTYSKLTIEQLNETLDKAILDEDYEKASLLRDELKKRTQTNN